MSEAALPLSCFRVKSGFSCRVEAFVARAGGSWWQSVAGISKFSPMERVGNWRKIGYSQPIRFQLSPLFRRHDGERIGGSPHFSPETVVRCAERQLPTSGAVREARPGYGLMGCGSFGIARSRQNGLGSIPLSCVTRSVDRLTDKSHVEDLNPVRGAPVCRSLKASALTGPE